jgi:hypothetical protein
VREGLNGRERTLQVLQTGQWRVGMGDSGPLLCLEATGERVGGVLNDGCGSYRYNATTLVWAQPVFGNLRLERV